MLPGVARRAKILTKVCFEHTITSRKCYYSTVNTVYTNISSLFSKFEQLVRLEDFLEVFKIRKGQKASNR